MRVNTVRKRGPYRGEKQRHIGHAAGPAVDHERLQINVVLLQSVHAGKFERTHAIGKFKQGAERQFLQAETAAAAHVVGLNELRAFAKHGGNRIERQRDDDKRHQRGDADCGHDENAQALGRRFRGEKGKAEHDGAGHREMKPCAA